MKKYRLFTADDRESEDHNADRMAEFAAFLTALSKGRKAHTVTTWHSSDGHENGFFVWYT